MPSTIILLKSLNAYEWQLFAPKGHPIGPVFRGDEYKALEWAQIFISTWPNWIVRLDEGEQNEEEDRLPRSSLQGYGM